MTRVLLYCWNGLNTPILRKNIEALGYEVIPFVKELHNYDMDGDFAMAFMTELHKNHCNLCFSFNYIPLISSICEVTGIPYISWVYDSPNLTLLSRTVYHKCNAIFVFDKMMYESLQSRGVKKSFYMPLAVDTEYFEEVVQSEFEESYEVSFVGSLYTNQYNYFEQISEWEQDEWEICNCLIQKQKFCYVEEKIRNGLSDAIVESLVDKADLRLSDKYEQVPREMVTMMLQKKVTVEERRELLEVVSEKFPLALYTGSDTSELVHVQNKGKADYLTVMPKVFANSRINLNMSLRSIESGIPLRALDIMACGGFLLSNYQPELAEYFEEGKELVLFYDKQDCLEKIAYYLSHEEERARIAEMGQKKVRELFGYQNALRKIFALTLEDSAE